MKNRLEELVKYERVQKIKVCEKLRDIYTMLQKLTIKYATLICNVIRMHS